MTPPVGHLKIQAAAHSRSTALTGQRRQLEGPTPSTPALPLSGCLENKSTGRIHVRDLLVQLRDQNTSSVASASFAIAWPPSCLSSGPLFFPSCYPYFP